MMKRIIAIFTSASAVAWSDTKETQLGLCEGRKVTLTVPAATMRQPLRHVPSNLPYIYSMSLCPPFAPFFGFAGVASAMVLSTVGAAFGTSKAGIGIAGLGTFKPELIMKSLIPVVMSGIIAVYGLVVSVLIAGALKPHDYSLFAGFVHLGAGVACGATGLAAGYAIGHIGDSCVRAYVYESKVFVSMVLILIFAEVLGLYGLIVALIMNTKAVSHVC